MPIQILHLQNHETVTIDGRNGTHLPKGTNVKIIDVAGNLVYETNVVEGEQLQGGKVVWNKKNLAGNNVAQEFILFYSPMMMPQKLRLLKLQL